MIDRTATDPLPHMLHVAYDDVLAEPLPPDVAELLYRFGCPDSKDAWREAVSIGVERRRRGAAGPAPWR